MSRNHSSGRVAPNHDGKEMEIAIVAARFNDDVVSLLYTAAYDTLIECGVAAKDITTVWVPGAWEIPVTAALLAGSDRYDAIVALGAVIRGDTYHFEVVADQSAAGLMRVATDTRTPVGNGIITVDNLQQAMDRAGGSAGNKGAEAALAVVETLNAWRAAAAEL